MKEKGLYLIIGLLLGVIVMQAKQGPQPAQAQLGVDALDWTVYDHPTYALLHWVIKPSGEVYVRTGNNFDPSPPINLGSFWVGGPVPASPICDWEVIQRSDLVTYVYVKLENGDVYWRSASAPSWVFPPSPPDYIGNFWGTPPVPTNQESWGGVKSKYKTEGDQ